MPVTHLSKDDEWQNALVAIFGRTTPDLAPLADMLRATDHPVPVGVRHTIADMVDPNAVGGYLGFRLEIRQVASITHIDGKRMAIAIEYYNLHKEKTANGEMEPSKASSEELAERHGISDRTVERYVHEFRDWLEYSREWIKSRLK